MKLTETNKNKTHAKEEIKSSFWVIQNILFTLLELDKMGIARLIGGKSNKNKNKKHPLYQEVLERSNNALVETNKALTDSLKAHNELLYNEYMRNTRINAALKEKETLTRADLLEINDEFNRGRDEIMISYMRPSWIDCY